MSRQRVERTFLVAASAAGVLAVGAPPAFAEGATPQPPPVTVIGGDGGVDTTIQVPGSSGGGTIVQPVGGAVPMGRRR